MITRMYSVYDIKSQIYYPPQFCHNEGHAMRVFMTRFSNTETLFNKFPEDFRVYELGMFNDSTGEIKPVEVPILLCEGLELVETMKSKDKITEMIKNGQDG